MHVLYDDRIYANSIVFSYFKRKHQDCLIIKNVITHTDYLFFISKVVKLLNKTEI